MQYLLKIMADTYRSISLFLFTRYPQNIHMICW